jgi:ribosomal protein L40E
MSNVVYFNGPVQNGDFTLAGRPGKAAGIRLAEALNALLGLASVPHLWNTVTLAGDLRHRRAADAVGRQQREERAVAEKYAPGPTPAAGLLTDTAPGVAALALEMTEALLADGTLAVREMPVRLCARCGHLTGTVAEDCRACGHGVTRGARRALLVFDRAAHGPVLGRDDFHAAGARAPAHLLNIAHNLPQVLVLSRTRDHGVSLAPLGLEGMVLDPRAGLHVAVLAAAAERGAVRPVMTVTENAAANVAAYGAPFRAWGGMRLRYALHGRIAYDAAAQERLYEVHRAEAVRELFTGWYLPLCAARERAGVSAARVPALLKFLRRAHLARPATSEGEVLAELRHRAAAGDMRWVMDARALACALADRENAGPTVGPQKGAP